MDTGSSDRTDLVGPLGHCRAFASVAPAVRDMLASQMANMEFGPREPLVVQGEPGVRLLVVEDGVADVMLRDETGVEQYLTSVSRGAIIGEMSLLTGEPCSATVVARTPLRALCLSSEGFHQSCTRYPSLASVLTLLLSERLGYNERDVLGGKVFAGFQVHRRLGRGGMSVVYAAEEMATGRPVALKMLSHRLAHDANALARFDREYVIIEALRNQHLVQTYGRFQAFGTYFIVMEYCDGAALAEVTASHPLLPENQVRRILGQLSVGLAHAHERGVVHRDVKPGNVMLLKDGTIKLMDFGLAEPVELAAMEDLACVVGTLGYMPPEQMRGEPLDARADIYAFGCLAYELMTGAPLFAERRPYELLDKQMALELPAPDDIRKNLPADFYQLLNATLRPDPSERTLRLDDLVHWAGPVDPSLLWGLAHWGVAPSDTAETTVLD